MTIEELKNKKVSYAKLLEIKNMKFKGLEMDITDGEENLKNATQIFANTSEMVRQCVLLYFGSETDNMSLTEIEEREAQIKEINPLGMFDVAGDKKK